MRWMLVLLLGGLATAGESRYFEIRVVDAKTGRGVPLVELETTGAVPYVTDSAGYVAFLEPGLMGQTVFFHVKSHGYEFPKDGFGFRGRALRCTPGGRAVLKIQRVNVAERLCRLTGGGIYRDSVLLGRPVPLRQPVLNARVLGLDSVFGAVWRGRIYWFWGDTNRPGYPLGNFAVSGATSPRDTDPERGIDYTYFVDESGFARKMCPLAGPGPVWLGGLMVVGDRLVAQFSRMKSLGEAHERGLVVFDEEQDRFVKLARFDLGQKLYPYGHPVRVAVDGETFFYFGNPFPNVRVRADLEAVQEPAAYEALAWTGEGYAWQRGAAPVGVADEDSWVALRDVATGKPVRPHSGSVAWNAHRRKWIAIVEEAGGTSFLGEVWYAEADTILGPWAYARKIVTHDRYSFYNVVHHPFLDRDNGRIVYFEGTYTDFLVKHAATTPRYNYNQILYRLDLADPRLQLPRPVYSPDRTALRHFAGPDGRRYENPLKRLVLGRAVPAR